MKELVRHHRNSLLAHAYLIEGESARTLPELIDFLEKELFVSTKGNPDVSFQDFETLTIDEVRALKGRAGKRAVSGLKIFILQFGSAVAEAQNALLKLLEEPPANTHFFLLMPSGSSLLPTLRSRLQTVSEAPRGERVAAWGEEFLEMNAAKRIAFVKDIIGQKDAAAAKTFLNELERVLYERNTTDHTALLKEIQQLRRYLDGRSASIKMILEHIALTAS